MYFLHHVEEAFGITSHIRFDLSSCGKSHVTLTHPNWSEIEVSLEEARITYWKTSDGIHRILHSKDTGIMTDASCHGLIPTIHSHDSFLHKSLEGHIQSARRLEKLNWEVVSTTLVDNFQDPRPTIVLRLRDLRKKRSNWAFALESEYKISLGINLSFDMITNSGHENKIENKRLQNLDRTIYHTLSSFKREIADCSGMLNKRKSSDQARSMYIANILDSDKTAIDAYFRYEKKDFKASEFRRLGPPNNLQTKTSTAAPVEGVIAKRKRLEKEKGQPAYFKYKIAAGKYLDLTEDFNDRGYPEDVHMVLKNRNVGSAPMKYTTELVTVFSNEEPRSNLSTTWAQTLGLGLSPFIDIRNRSHLKVGSDMNDSLVFDKTHLDRYYPNSTVPTEIFFTAGDRSHFTIIEREGFNDLHVRAFHNNSNGLQKRYALGQSPCRVMEAIHLLPGEEWRGRTTFRWFPLPMPTSYCHMDYVIGRKDLLKVPPDRLIPRRIQNLKSI